MRLFFVTIIIFSLLLPSANAFSMGQISPGSSIFVVQMPNSNLEEYLHQIDEITAEKIFDDIGQTTSWYRIKTRFDLNEIQSKLSGRILNIQSDYPMKASAVFYNDPWFSTDAEDTEKQWGLAASGFPESWQQTTGKPSVIVAVIDTGLDATHEDFAGSNLLPVLDVETRREITGRVNTDENGHGTLVTGVIAATANNNLGIAGAAPGISILPVRALDNEGNGTSSSVSAGITWAVDKGASVINLSLGGLGFAHDVLLSNAIEYAYRKGAVVVSAAGNDAAVTGGSLDVNPVFPICNDNGENMVLGVTAVDFRGLKPSFANFGKACVDVTAPGRRIISTINHDPVTGAEAKNSYAYASGTSLAVPFVSSQAALLKSLYSTATPRQIADRITSTAQSVDKLNLSQCEGFPCAGLLGAGSIRVASSLTKAIMPTVADGDLVKDENNNIFAILGGRRRSVVPFVLNQRFSGRVPKNVLYQDLLSFPEGPSLEPQDGTLLKRHGDQTVYYMDKGIRLAVTYQVFLQRRFQFTQVVEMDSALVASWVMGSFLPPKDGSLVKAAGPTVYWVVGGALHPINYNFWKDRGLHIFPITIVSDGDLRSFPVGEAYVR